MGREEDLYRDWVVVATGIRYLIGKELERDGNRSRLANAFEILILRGQQQSKDGTMLLTQNNAWTTAPLCIGGVIKEVVWSEHMRLSDLSAAEFANHVRFIESAKRDFENNRAAAAGLTVASPEDLKILQSLGKQNA